MAHSSIRKFAELTELAATSYSEESPAIPQFEQDQEDAFRLSVLEGKLFDIEDRLRELGGT